MTDRETQRVDAAEVVFVCSGNRARSPLAEALLRRKVDPRRVAVTSYGTLDLGSPPALANAVAAGKALGIDLSSHRARTLPPGALQSAQLVVGFEPPHLAAAVEKGKADPGRVFLLLDLPDLLDGIDAPPLEPSIPRADWIVGQMNERRAAGPATAGSLPDPYGEPMHTFTETARVIDALTSLVASVLAPST